MRKNFGAQTWMYPMPVLIVGTYDENGRPDAMNAAWGGIYETNQIMLCLSENHKTTKNIRAKGSFTVSFATADTAVPADYVGLVSGNNTPIKWKSPVCTQKRVLQLMLRCFRNSRWHWSASW